MRVQVAGVSPVVEAPDELEISLTILAQYAYGSMPWLLAKKVVNDFILSVLQAGFSRLYIKEIIED